MGVEKPLHDKAKEDFASFAADENTVLIGGCYTS
jgi:hypothetical protein